MTKILLIGGSGRSGTTVLCRAVGKHPDVTDVPEWRFTTDPDGIIDFYSQSVAGVQTPFHFDKRVRRLKKLLDAVSHRGPLESILGSSKFRNVVSNGLGYNLSPAYSRTDAMSYSPNFRKYSHELLNELKSFTFPGHWVGMSLMERAQVGFSDGSREDIRLACRKFLESIAKDVCHEQNAKFHLEKNTWNILCWDWTYDVLPDARLVHIVRDPRDVVASYMSQPWVPADPVRAARMLSAIMSQWDDVKSRVPERSFYELRLEDLTADPQGEYRKLCQFWDLEWSETLLETKLSPASFGRWKKDLSGDQIEAVTAIVNPILKKYEYV